MKRYLLVIMLFANFCALRAQSGYWEEAKGPYGGNVQIIATHANVVYAFSQYAIYRSADYGEHWDRITVTEVTSDDYGEEQLTIGSSGTFYKIVSYWDGNSSVERKLYSSNDEGQTWLLRNNDISNYTIFETPSGALIAMDTPSSKIYRSTNGGVSWQPVFSSFFIQLGSGGLSVTPEGKILIGSSLGNRLLYSDNDGLTWATFNTPYPFTNNYLSTTGTIFSVNKFGVNTSDLYRTTDLGITWDTIPFNLGQYENLGTLTNLNNGKLLLSSSSSLFTSTNDGLTWSQLPFSPEQTRYFSLNTPLPNGDLLGLGKDALYRSSDEGKHWSFSAFGLRNATPVALKPLSQFTQIAVTGSGLWKTEDGGENWNRLLADTSTSFFYQAKPLALVNADSFAVLLGKNIWGSIDGGQSFGDLTPVGGLASGAIFATSGSHFFCTGNEGVLKRNGFMEAWTTVIPDASLFSLAEHPSGDLFALTTLMDNSNQTVTFWRSQDAGSTWEAINSLAFEPNISSALFIDQTGKIYITGYYDHAITLATSENNASSWTYTSIPDIYAQGNILVNNLGQIFTYGYEVLTSADEGESWYYLPYAPDPSITFIDLELSADGYLFATCYGLTLRSKNSTEQGAYIRGQVLLDADQDCSTPDAQNPLKNWIIALEGAENYFNKTSEAGRYTFFVDTGSYTVKALVPQNFWWSLCDSIQNIEATELTNADTANFIALPLANCPLISVNVAIPQLRRCFDNQVYIEYCNQGTEPADSAWVDVMLDPYLTFISSAQPFEIQANQNIRFFVGDVLSGDCGQFQLTVNVNCDSTVLGQTHCIGAHGFPDTLCTPVPNWSGANIIASVSCQDTTLQFKLENTGSAVSQNLEYIIIEDDVVLFSGQHSYEVGESSIFNQPANGSTWRIESAQEPGHPFSTLALAFAEGCGGFNSLGYINQFPVNGIQPSWHRMCVENIGSYDPNDKQGFPNGVGTDHNIRPGQDLDYLIRFQNTGTDTAFTVVIKDTLSAFLDPGSIRPGAGSHAYTWSLSGQGVISFIFNNIMLPDSNVNEPGSNGFVQFNISPYMDVPLGSVIKNEAAIYFDFNLPIITNTTWHTIEKSPLISAVHTDPQTGNQGLEVWPNPFTLMTNIRIQTDWKGMASVKLFDNLGNLVFQKTTFTPDIELRVPQLPAGLYWIEVRDQQERVIGRQKVAKQ